MADKAAKHEEKSQTQVICRTDYAVRMTFATFTAHLHTLLSLLNAQYVSPTAIPTAAVTMPDKCSRVA